MNKIFLIFKPIFIIEDSEEFIRCKAASDLLIKTLIPFKYADNDDDELSPWERYEQMDENDDEDNEDMPFTIDEQTCECHGTRYAVKFRYGWPFQFKRVVEDLSIGRGGCCFNIDSTSFVVITGGDE